MFFNLLYLIIIKIKKMDTFIFICDISYGEEYSTHAMRANTKEEAIDKFLVRYEHDIVEINEIIIIPGTPKITHTIYYVSGTPPYKSKTREIPLN